MNDRKANITVSSVTVRKIINSLNLGMGHDLVHSRFLKYANDNLVDNLVNFINLCFRHCYIPTELLKGEITPILKDKKGSISDSNNYRPVMQSSCILKIFESHLLDFLSEKLFFNSRQFGFVKGLSTTHSCLLLKEIIHNYSMNKGKVFSCFIDLSKAFDRVNHFKLCNMLLNRGVPSDITKLILSYLNNQSARIKWCNSTGEFLGMNQGVRQGGVLSPLLFKLYIDDILNELVKLDVGCKFGLSRVNAIAYADDIVLISNSIETLEIIYKKFKENIDNLDLMMNANKSKCMIFTSGNKKPELKSIKLGNQEFEVVDSYKYLGNVIQFNLRNVLDIEQKLQSFYSSYYSILRNFNHVNIQTFLFIFKSYCLPSYGLALWNGDNVFSHQIFKTFEIAYSGALKRICNVPKFTSSHHVAEMCDNL